MRSLRRTSILSMVLVLVLLGISFQGCRGNNAPASPIVAELLFSEPPKLGETVQLTATFRLRESSKSAARNVTASILLPDGFEKVDGTLEWKGDMNPGAVQVLTARVRATRIGDYEFTARARFKPNETDLLGGTAVKYVTVTTTGATVGDTFPVKGAWAPAVQVTPLPPPSPVNAPG